MDIDNNIDISSDIVKTTDDNAAKDLVNLEFLSELDKANSNNNDFNLLNSTIAEEDRQSTIFNTFDVENGWLNSVSDDLILAANNSTSNFDDAIFDFNIGNLIETPSVFEDNYISGFDIDNLKNTNITQSPSIFNDGFDFINDPLAGSFDSLSGNYFGAIANGFLENEDFRVSQIYLSKEEYGNNYNSGFKEEEKGSGYELNNADLTALYNFGKPEIYDQDSVENSKTAFAFAAAPAALAAAGAAFSSFVFTKNLDDTPVLKEKINNMFGYEVADVKLAENSKKEETGKNDNAETGNNKGQAIDNIWNEKNWTPSLDDLVNTVPLAKDWLPLKKGNANSTAEKKSSIMSFIGNKGDNLLSSFPAVSQNSTNIPGFEGEKFDNVKKSDPVVVEQNYGTGFKSLPEGAGEISGVEAVGDLNDLQIYLAEKINVISNGKSREITIDGDVSDEEVKEVNKLADNQSMLGNKEISSINVRKTEHGSVEYKLNPNDSSPSFWSKLFGF